MLGRKPAKSKYCDLYQLAPSERSEFGWHLCVYCGDPADTVDHVPPLSRVDDYRALRRGKEYYLLVKSCAPCNTMLSNDLHMDIFERIDAVKFRLKRSIRKHDSALQWCEADLDELGPNLRSQVIASMNKVQAVQRRIDYRGGYKAILGMSDDL